MVHDLLLYQDASTFFNVALSDEEQWLTLADKVVTMLWKSINNHIFLLSPLTTSSPVSIWSRSCRQKWVSGASALSDPTSPVELPDVRQLWTLATSLGQARAVPSVSERCVQMAVPEMQCFPLLKWKPAKISKPSKIRLTIMLFVYVCSFNYLHFIRIFLLSCICLN